MSLNLQAKDSFFIFDNYGMLVVKSDELSWRDSIGMTVCAWIAYGRPDKLKNGLDKCLPSYNKPMKLLRYPGHKEESSRDHWSYFIIYTRMTEDDYWFKDFIWRTPKMRGLYLWMHSLAGNKLAEFFYYLIYIPGARIGNIWLKFCRWVGIIRPELDNKEWIFVETDTLDEYENTGLRLQRNRTKWQKLWAWIIFQTIPAYPLHNKAWQIYVMPESKKKDKLHKVLLRRIAKRNVLVRLILGDDTVTQQEVDDFPEMTGFPSGVYLDETCRRTIRKLTAQESEYNTYEKDLIIYLFNKTKNHE